MSARPAPDPARQAPSAAGSGPSRAEQARALLALLEPGGAAGPLPAGSLRGLARDLVASIEARDATAVSADAADADPVPPPPPRPTLFSRLRPVTLTPPPSPAPPPPERPEAGDRAALPGRLTLSAPLPHGADRTAPPAPDGTIPPAEVRALVSATLEAGAAGAEHPAIAALDMLGRPTPEQAAAMRSLPAGYPKAVHRALRELEKGPFAT